MSAPFLIGLLLVAGGITALSAFAGLVRAWDRRRPDPAWKPRTPVQKFTGYDQDKAVAAKHRANELEKSVRKLAATRSRPRTESEGNGRNVIRIEKKSRSQ